MSQENVEVVRRANEAWNRDDLDAALLLIHPDIEVRQPGDLYLGMKSVYQHARGRLSGVQVELPLFAQIVHFRGGRILRIDNYLDVEEARKAAGMSAQEVHADS